VAAELIARVRATMNRRFGVLPFHQSQPDLEAWMETPLGNALVQEEKESLDQALGDLFGYHLMTLSISRKLDLTSASRVQHCFPLMPLPNVTGVEAAGVQGDPNRGSGLSAGAVADIQSLPLASEAIDVAVLHHVLEYSQGPHQLLRETARVIIPRGHVVIVGFNPISNFGLWKVAARIIRQKPHWRYHSLRLGRVLDWLRLLDFEPVSIQQGFYRPPLQQMGLMRRLQWVERWGKKAEAPFGGYYLIVARKDVAAMTPIKPVWQSFNPITSLGVRKPTPRMPDPAMKPLRKQN